MWRLILWGRRPFGQWRERFGLSAASSRAQGVELVGGGGEDREKMGRVVEIASLRVGLIYISCA